MTFKKNKLWLSANSWRDSSVGITKSPMEGANDTLNVPRSCLEVTLIDSNNYVTQMTYTISNLAGCVALVNVTEMDCSVVALGLSSLISTNGIKLMPALRFW